MGSLDERGVTLSILDYSIDDIKQLSATEFKVTVNETYGIDHPKMVIASQTRKVFIQ